MVVQSITTPNELQSIISKAEGKLVVLDFTAEWCGPCKKIAPAFDKLSNEHTDVVFVRIDLDASKELVQQYGVSSVPSFFFVQKGKTLDSFSGANEEKLVTLIKKFKAADGTLTPMIELHQVACLNQSKNNTVKHLFDNSDSFLESDCDEQLLIYLPFQQPVKIQSISVTAPDVATAPKTLKLYINQPNMDFNNDNIPVTQEVVLTAKDVQERATVPLKFVKFQNVTSLTVFVVDNQGGGEVTRINSLQLLGTFEKASSNESLYKAKEEALKQ